MLRPLLVGRTVSCLLVLSFCLLASTAAQAQVTEWVGTTGDWATASNWSNGVPTAGVDAEVPLAATPTVTLPGATCRNLRTGTRSGDSMVRIQSGSLTVAQTIHIATDFGVAAQQVGGTVTANTLVLGNPDVAGAYVMSAGAISLTTLRVATSDPTSSGIFSMAGLTPQCTIGDSLVIGPDGSFVCGAGTVTVGGGTRVDGAFTFTNTPSVTTSGFTLGADGAISVAITPLGISKISVTGTAVLDGALLVTDAAAPNGTYEILTAGSIQGGFASSFLPPDWSWRVEGNSLLLTKGTVPVERTTWGGIKRARG